MKKYMMLGMVLLLISIPCVMAVGTGLLKITPNYPTTSPSPTDFTVWCNSGSSYDVEILLVVTEDCWSNMIDSGAVTVKHEGLIIASFDPGHFTPVTGTGGVYVPPSGASNGARYTVASLKDHLDYGMSEPLDSEATIYWAMAPLLTTGDDFDPLGESPEVLTITLNSGEPRMLVYLMGKSENNGELLDMSIPPTMAGFMVPEVAIGSIMAVASMFTALGLYTYKKKHTAQK